MYRCLYDGLSPWERFQGIQDESSSMHIFFSTLKLKYPESWNPGNLDLKKKSSRPHLFFNVVETETQSERVTCPRSHMNSVSPRWFVSCLIFPTMSFARISRDLTIHPPSLSVKGSTLSFMKNIRWLNPCYIPVIALSTNSHWIPLFCLFHKESGELICQYVKSSRQGCPPSPCPGCHGSTWKCSWGGGMGPVMSTESDFAHVLQKCHPVLGPKGVAS